MRTVLIIDDDEDDVRFLIEAFAEVDGTIDCRWAPSGPYALAQLHTAPSLLPDLIVLDLNMPIMNGHQCLQQLKAISRLQKVPVVIFSTARSERELALMECFEQVYFLVKPARFSDLKSCVAYLCQDQWTQLEAIGGKRLSNTR